MSKMYYAENPDAAHDIHELRVELLGQKMTFLTDAGVFSKKIVDFGSQLLLKCLEVNQGETVLDVGCGYGPLGLSLAKAYGVQATMVDINTRALDLARRNAEKIMQKRRFSSPTSMNKLKDILIMSFPILLSVRASKSFMKSLRKVKISWKLVGI